MKCATCGAEIVRCAQCLTLAAYFKQVFCVEKGKAHCCSVGCINVYNVKRSKAQTTLGAVHG